MNPLNLIRENFIAKAAYFANLAPGMSVVNDPQYVRVHCGLPSDTFNVSVLRETAPEAIEPLLESAVDYFTDQQLPMALWVFDSPSYPEISEVLTEYELPEVEVNIGMWADLQNLQLPPADREDFVVKPVTNKNDLHTFAGLIAALFGTSDEAAQIRAYYRRIAPYYGQQRIASQLYLGICKGKAVATGALFVTARTAGIYDIATRADQRGQGFGARMFQALLREAKGRGAGIAVLQASPDGLGIYRRAGFVEAGEVGVFENRHLL